MDEAICWGCQDAPIQSLHYPLCHACYRIVHKAGLLNKYRYPEGHPHYEKRRELYREKILSARGEVFINDLASLRRNTVTLRKVGDRHGVTREYIRQVYAKYYGFPYTITKRHKTAVAKVEKLTNLHNLDNRVTRYTEGCLQHKGIVIEKLVRDFARSIGYTVEIFPNPVIDMIINGYAVDVKSSYCSRKYSIHNLHKYFHFHIKNHQKQIAEFFICYAVPRKDFYVIPREAFPKSQSLYVRDGEGGLYNHGDNYAKYRNAWHLLDRTRLPLAQAAV